TSTPFWLALVLPCPWLSTGHSCSSGSVLAKTCLKSFTSSNSDRPNSIPLESSGGGGGAPGSGGSSFLARSLALEMTSSTAFTCSICSWFFSTSLPRSPPSSPASSASAPPSSPPLSSSFSSSSSSLPRQARLPPMSTLGLPGPSPSSPPCSVGSPFLAAG